ncbi:hypothetical protein NB311A_01844 [Nitrobacter sp. Nb-311A]|nr:hypothetical protein NB311A_01844 [Nitrobacter sp. Nb-311A]
MLASGAFGPVDHRPLNANASSADGGTLRSSTQLALAHLAVEMDVIKD